VVLNLVQPSRDFLLVGREAAWGDGPGAAPPLGLRARPWSLRPVLARVTPDGERVGTRDLDTFQPVPGRRYAQGDIPAYWRADTGGLLLLAALGADTVSSNPTGAVTRKKHLIRCADLPPSLYMQSFTGSRETSLVEKAYEHRGLRVDRFSMTWDATADTGALDFTWSLLGLHGERIAKPATTGLFSALNVQPAWKAVVNRDTATSDVMRGIALTFENNVARVKTGVGSQDDQMQQPGGRRVSGTLTYVYQTEAEFDLFEALGTEELEIIFTGVNFIETVTATDYFDGLTLHIPRVDYTDYGKEEVDGYYVQRIGFRGRHDDTIGGPVEFTVYNSLSAYAA
jgi:hypothetical protein